MSPVSFFFYRSSFCFVWIPYAYHVCSQLIKMCVWYIKYFVAGFFYPSFPFSLSLSFDLFNTFKIAPITSRCQTVAISSKVIARMMLNHSQKCYCVIVKVLLVNNFLLTCFFLMLYENESIGASLITMCTLSDRRKTEQKNRMRNKTKYMKIFSLMTTNRTQRN